MSHVPHDEVPKPYKPRNQFQIEEPSKMPLSVQRIEDDFVLCGGKKPIIRPRDYVMGIIDPSDEPVDDDFPVSLNEDENDPRSLDEIFR